MSRMLFFVLVSCFLMSCTPKGPQAEENESPESTESAVEVAEPEAEELTPKEVATETPQGVDESTPDDPLTQKAAIMGVLNARASQEMNQVIEAQGKLRIEGDWAFFFGTPEQPGGVAIDYKKLPFDAEETNVIGLLHREGGDWKLVEYESFCSDLCWEGWEQKHQAPAPLFR